jgi:hypothetical protein
LAGDFEAKKAFRAINGGQKKARGENEKEEQK